jgi:uncharacterized protein YlaI
MENIHKPLAPKCSVCNAEFDDLDDITIYMNRLGNEKIVCSACENGEGFHWCKACETYFMRTEKCPKCGERVNMKPKINIKSTIRYLQQEGRL